MLQELWWVGGHPPEVVIITVSVYGRGWEPFEVNVAWVGHKLAVLPMHHGATLQSAAETIVDLHCNTVCFIKLFGDLKIFSIV